MKMIIHYLIAWFMSHVPTGIGVGSKFDHPSRDKHNKGEMACGNPSKPHHVGRKIRGLLDTGMIVARQHMPCGAVLRVCIARTGKCAEAVRWESGPIHMAIDLYAPLSRKLEHNGMELVTWEIVR